MNCFPCCKGENGECDSPHGQQCTAPKPSEYNPVENRSSTAQAFTFRELAAATKNFHYECLVGEGGFGRVYRGVLPKSGKVVAVKQLDRNGLQGNNEFISAVSSLSLLQHRNFAELIGYCANGDQRLLVYEFVSGGSLEDCLFGSAPNRKTLDWFTRMKIAFGIAQGLEYLHDRANPPVIYGDLKSSNIMLNEELEPKLSHYGLTKLVPSRDKTFHVSAMGTYGYSPPECFRNGQITVRSDVYSFGVVLLELITGRKAIDASRPIDQQVLISWAQPFFRDPRRFPDMADPLLMNRYPVKDLNQVVAAAAMCLQEEPAVRPLIGDVVTTLSYIRMEPNENSFPVSSPSNSLYSNNNCT